jgi:hypothetical protein
MGNSLCTNAQEDPKMELTYHATPQHGLGVLRNGGNQQKLHGDLPVPKPTSEDGLIP